MNYGKIIYYDTANAKGLSTVLFVSGCEHHCEGCHNPETWNKNYGKEFTNETFNEILNSLREKPIKNFVISGGDPLLLDNLFTIIKICKEIKSIIPDINIIIYTGYKMEELRTLEYMELFQYIDYLIDGKFEINNRPKNLQLRGSLNQRCFKFKREKGVTCIEVTNEYFRN